MCILVTGAKGMLGTALVPVLQQRHHVWGIDLNDCDIRDAEAISAVLHTRQPELIIHLAAYADVDVCEANPQLAEATNSTDTRNVATACAQVGAAVLYVSIDYIFDRTKIGPCLEDDPPNPFSVYGQSKWLGEQHVRAILKRYFITQNLLAVRTQGQEFRQYNSQSGPPAEAPPGGERPAWLTDIDQAPLVNDCAIGCDPSLRRLPHYGPGNVFVV